MVATAPRTHEYNPAALARLAQRRNAQASREGKTTYHAVDPNWHNIEVYPGQEFWTLLKMKYAFPNHHHPDFFFTDGATLLEATSFNGGEFAAEKLHSLLQVADWLKPYHHVTTERQYKTLTVRKLIVRRRGIVGTAKCVNVTAHGHGGGTQYYSHSGHDSGLFHPLEPNGGISIELPYFQAHRGIYNDVKFR